MFLGRAPLDILQSVIPVFLVVAIGVVLRRYRFLDEGFIDAANSLVYYILLPALLFHEIGGTDFRQSFNGPLVVGGYAATLATFLLAFLTARALGLGPSETGAFVQGSFRANLAYVGLPIVFNAVGPGGLRKAGIFLGLIVPLLNGLSIVALMAPHRAGKGEGIGTTASRIARQIATNPIILACLAGIAWSVLKLPFPGMIDRTFRILTPATLPVALLCLGGSFSFARARKGFAVAALAAFLKGIVLTGTGIALYRWMGVSGEDLRIGAIMLGCPTAVVTYVMAARLRGDTDLAGTIVIVSTAASAVTITGWLFALRASGW
ncbi:AEC family transporter [Candidatus Deferrimicrobium sp.]|uniref:AEC family transporter n=1 Tax=Candidatus Deferrimicrobium sp. TaxID=3060586 RepID=UPI002EDA2AE3